MRRLISGTAAMLLLFMIMFPGIAAGQVGVAGEAAPFAPEAELLHLYVLDLLGADCMLLQHRGQNLLIDVGGDIQRTQLKALLDWLGVKEAAVFNSHPHADHLGGLPALMENISIPVFYTCFPEDERREHSRQQAAMQSLNQAGIPVCTLNDGDLLPFEGAELRVHQQVKGPVLNDCSAMIHLRYQEATMLLTADISQSGQTFFSKRAQETSLAADIMKAPHHGVERLQPRFLKAVSPEFVFFTHGSGDSRASWGLLQQRKIPYLFASRGVIHFSTDGSRWLAEQIGPSRSLASGKSLP